jgi:hypothetical protein
MAFEDVGAVPRERPLRPDVCPECGAETIVQAPRGGSSPILFLIVLGAFVPGMGLVVVLAGVPKAALIAMLAIIWTAAASAGLVLNFRYRGSRFLRNGFAICTECSWASCGREQGPGISRLWHRAVSAHRRLLILLLPLLVWTLLMMLLRRAPPLYLVPLTFAVNGVHWSYSCFLPRGWRPVWWRPWDYASPAGGDP